MVPSGCFTLKAASTRRPWQLKALSSAALFFIKVNQVLVRLWAREMGLCRSHGRQVVAFGAGLSRCAGACLTGCGVCGDACMAAPVSARRVFRDVGTICWAYWRPGCGLVCEDRAELLGRRMRLMDRCCVLSEWSAVRRSRRMAGLGW